MNLLLGFFLFSHAGIAQDGNPSRYAPLGWYAHNTTYYTAFNSTIANISFDNVSVEKALEKIAEKGEIRLSYDKSQLSSDPVNLELTNVTYIEAFQKILEDTDLTLLASPSGQVVIKKSKHALGTSSGFQTGTITGKVTDAETGEALSGANVGIEGTQHGSSTDENGQFRIEDVEAGSYNLIVSFVGYEKAQKEVTVAADEITNISFSMEPSRSKLNEVVVAGSVTETKKRMSPSPLTVVDAEDIEDQQIDQIQDMFRGQIPGIYAVDQGGANYYSEVQVRGKNSLYVDFIKTYVDGVEVADPTFIALLDPASIERVEIIRGPQASTLYGAGAAGGVMLISTKKGKSYGLNRPVINAKISGGIVESDFVDSPAPKQNHSLTISGGQKGFSYNIGGSYSSRGQFLPGNDFSKNSNGFLGVRWTQGKFNASLTGRYSNKVTNTGSSPYFPINIQSNPNRTFENPTYGLGLNLSYKVKDWWEHNVIVGFDVLGWEQSNVFSTTPSDTLYEVQATKTRKSSVRYNTTATLEWSSDFETIVTGGFEYYHNTGHGFLTQTADRGTGMLTANSFSPRYQEWKKTGYFVQALWDIRDKLSITTAIRAENHENFGEEFGMAWAPRIGASYSASLGTVFDAKVRASYGKAIRAPNPSNKSGGVLAGGSLVVRPNQEIGPEINRGWDAGVELYWGSMASLGITYYNQSAVDLIDHVLLQFNPPTQIVQYQNVGTIENNGWEFSGSLALNRFELETTFSVTNSTVGELAPNYTGNLQPGDPSLRIPKYQGGANLLYNFGSGSIRLGALYVGERTNLDYRAYYDFIYGNAPYRGSQRAYWMEYDSRFLLNLSANISLTKQMSLFLKADNLTNNQEGEGENHIPSTGRTTTVGIKARF